MLLYDNCFFYTVVLLGIVQEMYFFQNLKLQLNWQKQLYCDSAQLQHTA